mmetsp:Transcript_18490/g.38865  ORF Transcript_18490/g.38865 Transcript_18490/m.38865 type:complete len:264 (+) Transcript_18490:236-1027(+)
MQLWGQSDFFWERTSTVARISYLATHIEYVVLLVPVRTNSFGSTPSFRRHAEYKESKEAPRYAIAIALHQTNHKRNKTDTHRKQQEEQQQPVSTRNHRNRTERRRRGGHLAAIGFLSPDGPESGGGGNTHTERQPRQRRFVSLGRNARRSNSNRGVSVRGVVRGDRFWFGGDRFRELQHVAFESPYSQPQKPHQVSLPLEVPIGIRGRGVRRAVRRRSGGNDHRQETVPGQLQRGRIRSVGRHLHERQNRVGTLQVQVLHKVY